MGTSLPGRDPGSGTTPGRVHPVPRLRSLSQNACQRRGFGSGFGQWFMAKSHRPVLRDQPFLMPPDMREWLPADHLVWFLLDTIDVLDTSEFDRCRRRGGVGAAGYDPQMLLGLLIYAYCRGIRSSRQIERLCSTDVAFRVLCAQDAPDHCTVARFRVECQAAFATLFTQVLMIAGRVGLGHFDTVAIDGTKIAASASIDANRGHDWLSAQVSGMVIDAERTDASEDSDPSGAAGRGDRDRLPASLVERSGRAKRIREAAAEVEAQLTRQHKQDAERATAAQARLVKSEAGEPMVGRIPDGPHRLAEARAHLAREITAHQARLDRRAAIMAAGKKPLGAPPCRWRNTLGSFAHDESSKQRWQPSMPHPPSRAHLLCPRQSQTSPIRTRV